MLVLWLLAGVAMMSFLRGPDVGRTQEARVLEGAREMLGDGLSGWMVPHLNGHVRLEKPPLAYWMAAAFFKLRGVGPAAGRIPFALLGWLGVGLVYSIGRDLFSRVAGVAAAAALMGSYLVFRHARLAETDGPATLFVTASIWWMWRGLRGEDRGGRTEDSAAPSSILDPRSSLFRVHLSAIALALALMSKQGTVVYPLLFLLLWAIVERRWSILWRWISSGAPLTFLLIGAPWFLYVGHLLGWKVFIREMSDVTAGRDHFGLPFVYIPMLMQALVPWAGVSVIAIVAAIRRWKSDERIRLLLIWCASIFVPLCFVGNKQFHYLMPLMPPMALLSGWLIEMALQEERRRKRGEPRSGQLSALRAVVGITLLILLLAAGAVFFIGSQRRGAVALEDVICSAALLLVSVWGLAVFVRRPAAAALFGMCAAGAVLPYVVGRWLPSLDRHDHRALATHLKHRFPPELNPRYCFYGKNESVPLIFALKQIVPQYETEAELRAAIIVNPKLVVIGQTKNGTPPPPVPPPLEEFYTDRLEDQSIVIYVVPHKPAATSPASRATQPSARRAGSTRPASSPR
jgi:4-amino-4-deoxy-L-arabinose transferase-like glycosyltransferase